MMLVFGALLLLYAGGCTLFGGYMIGRDWLRTGLPPFRSYIVPFILIGGATIIVSGLLGWLAIAWGRGQLSERNARLTARIIGGLVMLYVAASILFDLYLLISMNMFPAHFPRWLAGSFWTLVIPGLPGWLLWRWGRKRGSIEKC
jgi:hypothetical protein